MMFPPIPPKTRNIRYIQPDNEKCAIGVYKAPTLQPFDSLVPKPMQRPPAMYIRACLKFMDSPALKVSVKIPIVSKPVSAPNIIPKFCKFIAFWKNGAVNISAAFPEKAATLSGDAPNNVRALPNHRP